MKLRRFLPLALCLLTLALLPSCSELRARWMIKHQPEGMSMEESIVRLKRGKFPELREWPVPEQRCLEKG